MKRLGFISDLELKESGGGSYAVHFHAFRELEKMFEVTYPGALTVRPSPIDALVSKFRRKILKRPSAFHYFSQRTLRENARKVSKAMSPEIDAVFFRSSARWCKWKPDRPYFIYLDVVFQTFFENTFDPSHFEIKDLKRIYENEASFLEGAAGVFFESGWGMKKAIYGYNLKGTHYATVGRGGVIEPPAFDLWDGCPRLLSVAMNFYQKGGDLILKAFKLLKPTFPDLTWHIVGGEPAGDWESIPGIVYEGVLRPDDPDERERLGQLYAKSFLLLHPTREDTNPLVLTEAAYFGCPAVSVRNFAIPELVIDGETGILLDTPVCFEELADSIKELLSNRDRYLVMREQARCHSLKTSQWGDVGARITGFIKNVLG